MVLALGSPASIEVLLEVELTSNNAAIMRHVKIGVR